jgi:hypothetical protein
MHARRSAFFLDRYELHNMLQLCVLPGPKRPVNIWNFLEPLLMKELRHLAQHGILVERGPYTYHAKAHLLAATGDLPGVAQLTNHGGHMSRFGCRICLVEGVRPEHGMYFTGRDVAERVRTTEELRQGDKVNRSLPKENLTSEAYPPTDTLSRRTRSTHPCRSLSWSLFMA